MCKWDLQRRNHVSGGFHEYKKKPQICEAICMPYLWGAGVDKREQLMWSPKIWVMQGLYTVKLQAVQVYFWPKVTVHKHQISPS